MHRYDWILLAIPIALLGGGLIGLLTPVPMEYGLAGGFVLSTPLVYDAMFRNPPLPESQVQRAAVAVVWHALLVWVLIEAIV